MDLLSRNGPPRRITQHRRTLAGQTTFVNLTAAEAIINLLQPCAEFVEPPITIAADPLSRVSIPGTATRQDRVILPTDCTHPGGGVLQVMKSFQCSSYPCSSSPSAASTSGFDTSAPFCSFSHIIIAKLAIFRCLSRASSFPHNFYHI